MPVKQRSDAFDGKTEFKKFLAIIETGRKGVFPGQGAEIKRFLILLHLIFNGARVVGGDFFC